MRRLWRRTYWALTAWALLAGCGPQHPQPLGVYAVGNQVFAAYPGGRRSLCFQARSDRVEVWGSQGETLLVATSDRTGQNVVAAAENGRRPLGASHVPPGTLVTSAAMTHDGRFAVYTTATASPLRGLLHAFPTRGKAAEWTWGPVTGWLSQCTAWFGSVVAVLERCSPAAAGYRVWAVDLGSPCPTVRLLAQLPAGRLPRLTLVQRDRSLTFTRGGKIPVGGRWCAGPAWWATQASLPAPRFLTDCQAWYAVAGGNALAIEELLPGLRLRVRLLRTADGRELSRWNGGTALGVSPDGDLLQMSLPAEGGAQLVVVSARTAQEVGRWPGAGAHRWVWCE